jgi:hypothetical protein
MTKPFINYDFDSDSNIMRNGSKLESKEISVNNYQKKLTEISKAYNVHEDYITQRVEPEKKTRSTNGSPTDKYADLKTNTWIKKSTKPDITTPPNRIEQTETPKMIDRRKSKFKK